MTEQTVSRGRMIISALAVILFAVAVHAAVHIRSQPPPPPESGRIYLQKLEAGK